MISYYTIDHSCTRNFPIKVMHKNSTFSKCNSKIQLKLNYFFFLNGITTFLDVFPLLVKYVNTCKCRMDVVAMVLGDPPLIFFACIHIYIYIIIYIYIYNYINNWQPTCHIKQITLKWTICYWFTFLDPYNFTFQWVFTVD